MTPEQARIKAAQRDGLLESNDILRERVQIMNDHLNFIKKELMRTREDVAKIRAQNLDLHRMNNALLSELAQVRPPYQDEYGNHISSKIHPGDEVEYL